MTTTMQTVIPQLRIANAERSLAFYIDGLGFKVDWQHQFAPGFPLFFQITRASQTLFLTEHTGDCEAGGAVYFRVPDARSLYAEFHQRGIVATKGPEETPWRTCEFLLMDPDGNKLRFAHDL